MKPVDNGNGQMENPGAGDGTEAPGNTGMDDGTEVPGNTGTEDGMEVPGNTGTEDGAEVTGSAGAGEDAEQPGSTGADGSSIPEADRQVSAPEPDESGRIPGGEEIVNGSEDSEFEDNSGYGSEDNSEYNSGDNSEENADNVISSGVAGSLSGDISPEPAGGSDNSEGNGLDSSENSGSGSYISLGGGSRSGSSHRAVQAEIASGEWVKDETGWWYRYGDGTWIKGQWAYLSWENCYEWYYFGDDGYMKTGWFCDSDGKWYYLHPISDGTCGHMYTGWHLIGGKYYCFSGSGSLYCSCMTPDGYEVDRDGVWIP
jgi:hypothetical protein